MKAKHPLPYNLYHSSALNHLFRPHTATPMSLRGRKYISNTIFLDLLLSRGAGGVTRIKRISDRGWRGWLSKPGPPPGGVQVACNWGWVSLAWRQLSRGSAPRCGVLTQRRPKTTQFGEEAMAPTSRGTLGCLHASLGCAEHNLSITIHQKLIFFVVVFVFCKTSFGEGRRIREGPLLFIK